MRERFYFLQKYGVNNTRIVNNSNLPNNIKKDKNHFPIVGICAKLSTGHTDPIPGPILPKVAATEPIADKKSNPIKDIISDPKIKMITYIKKKAKILEMISSFTALPLSLTGIMAFGCINLFNSTIEFLDNNRILITLIPPEVEPAEPPKNIRIKKVSIKNGVQAV